MKLSIITINLNNKHGLEQTIQSVLSQLFKNYEFIVIDGNSDDGSKTIIDAYKENISYYISEPDSGIYNAMNKGIKAANGEYLYFLNSGDTLIDNTILNRVFKNTTSEDILCGNLIVWENQKQSGIAKPPQTISLRTLYADTLHHQASFIKKELFNKIGHYNEGYSFRSDWDFWINAIIINNCSMRSLNFEIANYNYDGLTAQAENQKRIQDETKKILLHYFPEKVIEDYEYFKNLLIEQKEFRWLKKHKLLYTVYRFLLKL